MALRDTDQTPSVRQDGFGARCVVSDPRLGRVERLDLTPVLSTSVSEQAIRARAAHLTSVEDSPLGRVLRIERKGDALSVLSVAPEGIPLSDLLAALEFKTVILTGEEVLTLAAAVVTAVATMHERLPSLAHGALTPAHIVLRRDGSAILTGAVYGDALQALQRNREHLWREFGVALPSAASLPRFDQRGDVTQLGAVVLAITMRRSLRRDEYPRSTSELAASTTVSATASVDSKLRTWLQDALLLHGRVVFSSAVEAARAFRDILPAASGPNSVEMLTLQTVIRQLCGDPEPPPAAADSVTTRVRIGRPPSQASSRADVPSAVAWAPAGVAAPVSDEEFDELEDIEESGSAERTFTFLRSLLPHLRAS
jgi:hypothetical protein